MRTAIVLLLLMVCGLGQADEVGERRALQRSHDMVEAINKGERLLTKAIDYGDERGFAQEVTRPMVRRLQWWRELEDQDPKEFEPFRSCLRAGVAFNLYSDARWDEPSLRRDRQLEQDQIEYKTQLRKCTEALKSTRKR